MKKNFRGWTTVFGFTFSQSTKKAAFKVVTIFVSLLIIGGFILGNLLSAKPSKELEPSPIETVFVLDNSGLEATDYQSFLTMMGNSQYMHIEFENLANTSAEDAVKVASSNSPKSIVVRVDKEGTDYIFKALIPETSDISENEADNLLSQMISAFNSNKLLQSGLTMDQLTTALKPVTVTTSDIGENSSEAVKFIKMFAPMIVGFILYFMLLIYGQDVSKSVSTEKTSKLIENLLTSAHPYALITGKVLAITSLAILQFVIWIGSVFLGLYGGNAIAHKIYPEYQNTFITIINYLRDNIGESAMSLPAIILAIIVFVLGFLFYCVLAGVAGSLVSKPEDAASAQGIFVFPIVISFLVCYLAPLTGNEGVLNVARYVPFTAPFSVPVDLITGAISLGEGVISLVLLFVFSLLVIVLSARIYKGMILYNGQNVNLKLLVNIIKADQ
jgi:ABC-type Na+ efflux pump permease subunit